MDFALSFLEPPIVFENKTFIDFGVVDLPSSVLEQLKKIMQKHAR
jgi:hypothetical protein